MQIGLWIQFQNMVLNLSLVCLYNNFFFKKKVTSHIFKVPFFAYEKKLPKDDFWLSMIGESKILLSIPKSCAMGKFRF